MPTTKLLSAICLAVIAWSAPVQAQQSSDEPAAPAPKKQNPAMAGEQAQPAAKSAAGEGQTQPAAAPSAAAMESQQPSAPAEPSNENMVQLKALEQRVNQLKERIFRSKARLNLLKETVLHGVIAGSRAIVKHKNDMGGSMRLIKLVYAIDGNEVYSKSDDSGALHDKREFEIFNGSIAPGNHTISVTMVFRGHGYGIFTYLKGYKFTVRASHTFAAAEGRQNVITARAWERGNATTELQDRPAIKFETSLYKVTSKKAAKPGAKQ